MLVENPISTSDWDSIDFNLKIVHNKDIELSTKIDEVLTIFDPRLKITGVLRINEVPEDIILAQEIHSLFNAMKEVNRVEDPLKQVHLNKALPSWVKLPSTYLEFTSKYFRSKCSLCCQNNSLNNLCICLLCGKTMCRRSCDPNNNPKVGNLSIHCLFDHAFKGVFLDIKEMTFYVVGFPSIAICYWNIYVNKFGTGVKRLLSESKNLNKMRELDFKTINLNEAENEKIRSLVYYGNEIPQLINEIRQGTLQNQHVFDEAYF